MPAWALLATSPGHTHFGHDRSLLGGSTSMVSPALTAPPCAMRSHSTRGWKPVPDALIGVLLHVLHGQAERDVGALLQRGQALQHLQQGLISPAASPRPAAGSRCRRAVRSPGWWRRRSVGGPGQRLRARLDPCEGPGLSSASILLTANTMLGTRSSAPAGCGNASAATTRRCSWPRSRLGHVDQHHGGIAAQRRW